MPFTIGAWVSGSAGNRLQLLPDIPNIASLAAVTALRPAFETLYREAWRSHQDSVVTRCKLMGFAYTPVISTGTHKSRWFPPCANWSPGAPFYTPSMPRSGKPMSVRMTNFGPLGWVTDRQGYRYQPSHPETGKAMAGHTGATAGLVEGPGALPASAGSLPGQPLYRQGPHGPASGHADEKDFDAPVLSVSLGDTAVFRIGGSARKDPTRSAQAAVR